MVATLHTPKSVLKQFVLAADRAYFAQPVPVRVLYSDVPSRLVMVEDVGARGLRYPVDPRNLRWS